MVLAVPCTVRAFSSITSLYLLHAVAAALRCDSQKHPKTLPSVSWGANLPPVKTTRPGEGAWSPGRGAGVWDGHPGQSLLGEEGQGNRAGGALEGMCPHLSGAENFRLQSGEEVHVWGA